MSVEKVLEIGVGDVVALLLNVWGGETAIVLVAAIERTGPKFLEGVSEHFDIGAVDHEYVGVVVVV